MTALAADLALLSDAARRAGEIAMGFFGRRPRVWSKTGGSPVTEADMAVDTFLREHLLAERPGYGWLSEETADDPVRRERHSVFVVDPIDGTRGFIEGDDRWCVSLAVVRGGRPVVAALLAPARQQFFTAIEGQGSWWGERRLVVSPHPELAGARLAGPRGWLKSPALGRTGAASQGHVPSLAYRFASVAFAGCEAAFASPRSQDWDLAACDLLVHEAGGRLAGLDGKAPIYNLEIPRHGVLAAANEILLPDLLSSLAEVARERGLAGLPV